MSSSVGVGRAARKIPPPFKQSAGRLIFLPLVMMIDLLHVPLISAFGDELLCDVSLVCNVSGF